MTRRVRSARLQPSPSSAYLSKMIWYRISLDFGKIFNIFGKEFIILGINVR